MINKKVITLSYKKVTTLLSFRFFSINRPAHLFEIRRDSTFRLSFSWFFMVFSEIVIGVFSFFCEVLSVRMMGTDKTLFRLLTILSLLENLTKAENRY